MSADSSDGSLDSPRLKPVPLNQEFRFWADENAPLRRELFGSESTARLWTAAALDLFRLSTHESAGLEALGVHSVVRDDSASMFSVEVSIPADDPCGYWLQIEDDMGDLHGIVLPADRRLAIRYSVEFHVSEPSHGDMRLSGLGAFASRQSEGPLSEAIAAWELYHKCNLSGAIAAIESLAAGGRIGASPLTAVLAALVALRANRIDLLKDTLLELARQFPAQPDLPVLVIEQLLRSRHDALHFAAQVLAHSLGQALPHTGEGLSYAHTLVHRMLNSRELLNARLVASLEEQQTRINTLLPHFRPGGLFVAFSGYAIGEVPWHVLGAQSAISSFPADLSRTHPFPIEPSYFVHSETSPRPPREAFSLWQHIETNLNVSRDPWQSKGILRLGEALGAALLPWFVRKGLSQFEAQERACETLELIFQRIDHFERGGNQSFRAWCADLAAIVMVDWLRSLMKFNPKPAGSKQLEDLANQSFVNEVADPDPYEAARLKYLQLTDKEREIINRKVALRSRSSVST